MAALLKPIKVKRVSDQAFEQIRDLIFRGQLKPGEQLMPERELAQALGVSRPTVRETIKQLVTMGLLEHRQGQGTFVRSIDDRRGLNPLAAMIEGHNPTLEELLEVRMGLEGQAVSLAAQRATPEDLQVLERPSPICWRKTGRAVSGSTKMCPFTWPSPSPPGTPCRSTS